MQLNHYSVTVRQIEVPQGWEPGESFVLPVDSPREEHAIAFICAGIQERR